MPDKKPLRVLVLEDNGALYAQCLEYDIAAFGPDMDTLRKRFRAVFEMERKISLEQHGEAFGGIDPAPETYFSMWNNCVVTDQLDAAGVPLSIARCAA